MSEAGPPQGGTAAAAPDARSRIMEEAMRLFVTRGYDGISMREIAEAVGITKAAIYYHYRDKEEVLLAILRSLLAAIERLIDEAQADGGSTRDQLERVMAGIFAMPTEQRGLIRLVSQEMPRLNARDYEEFLQSYHRRFIGRMERIVSEGIEHGEVATVDPALATWMLLGMAYPFLYPAHARELGVDDRTISTMIRIFFDGLAK